RVATGKDFDETTGALKKADKVVVLSKNEVDALVNNLRNESWKVTSVEEKPATSHPAPPFITSTLQQEANRKLGLSSRDAMRVAQKLYEEGRITYMRTDSPILSTQGIEAARAG